MEQKEKSYRVKVFDEGCYLHFLTSAINSKEALVNLQNNSSDYKNIVNANRDITIEIKEL